MSRLTDAWRAMKPEQRLAAAVSVGLFVSMFLPWYSKTDTVVVRDAAKATQTSLSAFEAFSFVEAAVLLVSAGVLGMLFARVEQRDFQLPGGDGLIVMIAGSWTAILIFYRLLDKPGLQGNERITATVGVEWGIFLALRLALGLVYAGARMRATERPPPPAHSHERERGAGFAGERMPRRAPEAEDMTTVLRAPAREAAPVRAPVNPRAAASRPRYPPAPSEQMSFEDTPPGAEEPRA
jgi:hypothetical protein